MSESEPPSLSPAVAPEGGISRRSSLRVGVFEPRRRSTRAGEERPCGCLSLVAWSFESVVGALGQGGGVV